MAQPRSCPGVPTDVLSPRTTWNNDDAYYKMAFKLSNAFRENFDKFEEKIAEYINSGKNPHWRFKLEDGTIEWNDLVKGKVSFELRHFSQQVQ